MTSPEHHAPGAPGALPTWSPASKQLIGCSLGIPRLWYTLGQGIITEVYYPRVDIPQIRDLGFIVADGAGFWVEVRRLGGSRVEQAASGVPVATIVHEHPRFTLTLRVAPAADRDALVLELALEGDPGLRPYALLAPHLGGTGWRNSAQVGWHHGRRILWASQGPFGLALAAVDDRQTPCWGRASAGYVGASDGWQDFARHGAMRWTYEQAGPGNVALMGELPRRAVLALAFGSSREAAATLARSTLVRPFGKIWSRQIESWQAWHTDWGRRCGLPSDCSQELRPLFDNSAMVLRAVQDKTYPGAMVASLSVPWGDTRHDRGGYHLVWPRDLVQCAQALVELGAEGEARDILRYLIASQLADGRWFQNQWLGGKPYWVREQLDEVAFPVLLAAEMAARDALEGIETTDMVRRALGYLLRAGPATEQDRWEENDGISLYTLAACIAALVAGADLLPGSEGAHALEVADFWNDRIEAWCSSGPTELARRHGVATGYYLRGAPAGVLQDPEALDRPWTVKNRQPPPTLSSREQVSMDFLLLVRLGLRRAHDPLVLSTLALTDRLLRRDLPTGSVWYRYNEDGYGERPDGGPFDDKGRGVGRPWPLLAGERGHHAVAAGEDVEPYLRAMARMAGTSAMLPEQVWDGPQVPELGLEPGLATGSARPLAWAHAELIKLVFSRALGRPVDRPGAVWARYRGIKPHLYRAFWSPAAPIGWIRPGERLVMVLDGRGGTVRWSRDGWRSQSDTDTREAEFELHSAELATESLAPGEALRFTYRDDRGTWAGRDWEVVVAGDAGAAGPGTR
jgi:glucoamylase